MKKHKQKQPTTIAVPEVITETESPIFKPKLRVQYLTPAGIVISDRLVDQAIEFYNGPKVSHKGPLRIESTLMDANDVEQLKAYITKIGQDLPAKEPNSKGRPSLPVNELKSPREDILEAVIKLKADAANQDTAIKYLRGLGFIFLLTEDFLSYFPEFQFNTRDIGKPNSSGQYIESLSWMVRCIKKAKDPRIDKYDPQIIFGFSMIGERNSKVVPYLYKERKEPLRLEVPKKNALSFNNTDMTKFPKYMVEDERLKFSIEMRQLMAKKDKQPSKFFKRWYQDVIFPNALVPVMEEIYNNRK